MDKYMTPYAEIDNYSTDPSSASGPGTDDNETDFMPWADWAANP